MKIQGSRFGLSLLLGLGLSLSTGTSLAAEKLSPQVADALIQTSGLADQLPMIEPSLEASLNLTPGLAGSLTEDQLATLKAAFSSAYSAERLKAGVAAELIAQLNPAAAKEALTWLESDLGKKITALEDASAKTAGDSATFEAAQKLFERLPPRRVDRYVRLVKASDVGESSAQLLINTSLGTALGVASLNGAGKASPSVEDLRKEFEGDRPEMVETLNSQFLILFSSAYQSLSEADLDQYIAFNESAAGVAYQKAMSAAIDRAMVQAATDAGRQVSEAVKARQPA